eukprot:GHVR01151629.1.p1 GENE.GHVR01151629.1~~GHVR01151629.1.p1  ORF type:complete len:216 (+),score=9.88 GHVR01151629.1:41-649(+)
MSSVSSTIRRIQSLLRYTDFSVLDDHSLLIQHDPVLAQTVASSFFNFCDAKQKFSNGNDAESEIRCPINLVFSSQEECKRICKEGQLLRLTNCRVLDVFPLGHSCRQQYFTATCKCKESAVFDGPSKNLQITATGGCQKMHSVMLYALPGRLDIISDALPQSCHACKHRLAWQEDIKERKFSGDAFLHVFAHSKNFQLCVRL